MGLIKDIFQVGFGGGGGWGGGGGGARPEPKIPPLWGPKGSGAVITPGENWPKTEDLIKNRGIWIVAAIAILALSSRD